MSSANLTRSLWEALQEQQSAGTSRSRSGASPTRRRRSTSSTPSRTRSTPTRRRRSASSIPSRTRSGTRQVYNRSRLAQTKSKSRTRSAPTRSRGSGTSSQQRRRAEEDLKDAQKRIAKLDSENQWRPPNYDEERALRFTFGDTVGNFLIENIEIGEGEGDAKNPNEVLLPPDYSSQDLSDLGDFIGKAVRVWQRDTGRYHQRKGGADYNYRQLFELKEFNDRRHGRLNLNGRQHVRAVQDWFLVSYGNLHSLIGTGGHMSRDELWDKILPILGVKLDKPTERFPYDNSLQQIVNNHYGCVIKEIRQRVQPVTLGGIKKIRQRV